jgi:hypothetical protein
MYNNHNLVTDQEGLHKLECFMLGVLAKLKPN